MVVGVAAGPRAESLSGALVKAYRANPSSTHNAREHAPRTRMSRSPNSGYLPHASATADVGYLHNQISTPNRAAAGIAVGGGAGGRTRSISDTAPRGVGLQVTKTLFDGFRTPNSIKQAESNVFGQRETLRNTEQSVLQSAAQAYMDVLRDTAVLELRNSNIKVLDEQLRQTQDRFKVGEVTRTDVAQARSRPCRRAGRLLSPRRQPAELDRQLSPGRRRAADAARAGQADGARAADQRWRAPSRSRRSSTPTSRPPFTMSTRPNCR